jgi:non-ribosomal peptide synthetase component F
MVMAGVYLVVREWLQRSDLVIGVVSSGRPPVLDAVESMIGFFINIIPVRIRCGEESSFIEVSRKIGEFLNSAAPYEYINLDEIKQSLNLSSREPHLFDVVLVFANYPVVKSLLEIGQEEGESILPMLYLNHVQVELPLRIDTRTFGIEQTSFILSYYRDKFAPQTIAEIGKGLEEKLTLAAQSPHKPIKDYLT